MDTKFPWENLALEGGGVRGIAYLGVFDRLQLYGILPNIKRVAGSSAGAIVATLLSLGYSLDELKKTLWETDLRKFKDDSFFFVRDASRFISRYGWHKGDYFKQWIKDLIGKKTGNKNATFADIKDFEPMLYLIACNLNRKRYEVFSPEHSPDVEIADAVRASMAIPFFFVPEYIKGEMYVDGGLMWNYPVQLWDQGVPNYKTLGVRLDSKGEIEEFKKGKPHHYKKVSGILAFIEAVIDCMLAIQDQVHMESSDWTRTIYVDSKGVGGTKFDLSTKDKVNLISSGLACTEEYIQWWSMQQQVN